MFSQTFNAPIKFFQVKKLLSVGQVGFIWT